MPEIREDTERVVSQKEKKNEYPNIHFEPGEHPDKTEEYLEIYERFKTGDLRAHGWNEEVLQRLKKYSPEIIAIDGLVVSSRPGEVYSPEYIWLTMPGSPGEINPKQSSLLVISGDCGYSNFPEKLSNVINPELDRLHDSDKTLRTSWGLTMTAIITIASNADLLSSLMETRFTRRDIFRLPPRLFLLSILERAPWYATRAKQNETKNFFVALTNALYRDYFNSNSVVDFRTALLISKEQDSIAFLGKPKETAGSVIMGNAHSVKAEKFLRNKEARSQIIYLFSENFLKFIDQTLTENPSISNEIDLKSSFLDFVSTTEIKRVYNPQKINGAIIIPPMESLGIFKSPQVEAAIAPLR